MVKLLVERIIEDKVESTSFILKLKKGKLLHYITLVDNFTKSNKLGQKNQRSEVMMNIWIILKSIAILNTKRFFSFVGLQ